MPTDLRLIGLLCNHGSIGFFTKNDEGEIELNSDVMLRSLLENVSSCVFLLNDQIQVKQVNPSSVFMADRAKQQGRNRVVKAGTLE